MGLVRLRSSGTTRFSDLFTGVRVKTHHAASRSAARIVPCSSSEDFTASQGTILAALREAAWWLLTRTPVNKSEEPGSFPTSRKPYKTQSNGVILVQTGRRCGLELAPRSIPFEMRFYFGTGDATTAPLAQDHRRRHGREASIPETALSYAGA